MSVDIEGLLKIAEYHREHERFYATHGLDQASALRRDAGALRALADRWIEGEARAPAGDFNDPRLQAAGCEDLNAEAALATTGILFMEGESEPAEIVQMRARLQALGEGYARSARWLAEKMDAGWKRESVLLTPEFADVAYQRHMALARTTMHGEQLGVAARLIGAAHAALSAQKHDPATIRADAPAAGRVLRVAAWLLDSAAEIVALGAAELSRSDPDWTAYIEGMRSRLT